MPPAASSRARSRPPANAGHLPGHVYQWNKRTADNSLAEVKVDPGKYWSIGDGVQPVHHVFSFERNPCRINRHINEQDDRPRWKRGDAFEHVFEGQFIEPRERHTAGERLKLIAYGLHPKLFIGRVAYHHRNMVCCWQQMLNMVDDAYMVDHARDNHVARRKVRECYPTLFNTRENHRNRRKGLLPNLQKEVGGGRADGHHEVEVVSGRKCAKVLRKRIVKGFVGKPCGCERCLENLHWPRQLPTKFRANVVRIFAPR